MLNIRGLKTLFPLRRFQKPKMANIFWRCLKMISLVLLAFAFSLPRAFAQNSESQPVAERQALITMANNGLYYFLTQAFFDDAFKNALTEQEAKMAQGLGLILEQANALRWFASQKIPYFTNTKNSQKIYTFAYVDMGENVIRFDSLHVQAPSLVFSNDRSRFQNLKPGQPERDARTSVDFPSAIEFNLHKLNQPQDPNSPPFDLGKAVSLMIHEYGNKLDQFQNEAAVDSLGSKLGDFVRGKTNTHVLQNGVKMFTMYFPRFRYREWLSAGFINDPADLSNGMMKFLMPSMESRPSAQRLSLFPDQGFYAWSEQDGRIANWTPQLIKQMYKPGLINHDKPEEQFYKFVEHNMYSVSAFDVVETTPGQVKFNIQLAHIEIVLPFMIPSISPDPRQAEFNKRYYYSQTPYFVDPQNMEISANYNATYLQITQKKEKASVIYFLPDLSARMTEVKKIDNHVEFKIAVLGNKLLPVDLSDQVLELNQAEVTLAAREKKVTVASANYNPQTSEFTFRLDNVDQIPATDLDVTQLFIKPTSTSLTDATLYTKVEVSLFNALKVPLQSTPPATSPPAPHLKSIQTKGKLNLVIDTPEKLRNLQLRINLTLSTFTAVIAEDSKENLHRKTTNNINFNKLIEVNFEATQFSQIQKDGRLYVEVNISEIYKLLNIDHVHENRDSADSYIKVFRVEIANSDPILEGISFVTDSFQKRQIDLKKPIKLDFSQQQNEEYQRLNELRQGERDANFMRKRCMALFL